MVLARDTGGVSANVRFVLYGPESRRSAFDVVDGSPSDLR